MKRTTQLLSLLLLCGVASTKGQSIGAESKHSSNRMDCSGAPKSLCISSTSVPERRTNNDAALPLHFIKDASGHLVMQVSKASLTEEQDRINYRNKYAFLVEEDVTLDDSMRKALMPDSEKPLVIVQGMYPIIEWEGHYYIRF